MVERTWNIHYGGLIAYRPDADWYFHLGRLSPLYATADRQAWDAGSDLTMKTVWPALIDISFKRTDRLDVPVYPFLGRHKAGVPIVAGTDGYGLELVRELELYQQAGLSNAAALQTATIVPARMTGMADRTGSIAVGKTADIILVDGDVSKDITNLRHVETVFLDGYRLDGKKLRQASGLSGMPK